MQDLKIIIARTLFVTTIFAIVNVKVTIVNIKLVIVELSTFTFIEIIEGS